MKKILKEVGALVLNIFLKPVLVNLSLCGSCTKEIINSKNLKKKNKILSNKNVLEYY